MTRLAISNIAWSPREKEEAFALLAEQGVRGLEIAPGLTFPSEPDPFSPSKDAVLAFRQSLDRLEIQLVSMQSLLYGLKGCRLFGSESERQCFQAGLERAAALARRLGIPNIVLGSPTNRVIPESMARADAERLAVDIFRRVGDVCRQAGTKLALEPNPAVYGTNFLNTFDETQAFVKRVAHPFVSINFDIGSLHINNEIGKAGELFAKATPLVSHVHISEPSLAPAPRDVRQFEALAGEILASGYDGWFSLEMRPAARDNVVSIGRAIASASRALQAAKSRARGVVHG